LSPEQVEAMRGDAQLVDVREDYEWDEGRIEGARHLALVEVAPAPQSIDRDRPVVFYCRTGARSGMATQAFRQGGYDAYNMAGGLERWAPEGRPPEAADGTVASH